MDEVCKKASNESLQYVDNILQIESVETIKTRLQGRIESQNNPDVSLVFNRLFETSINLDVLNTNILINDETVDGVEKYVYTEVGNILRESIRKNTYRKSEYEMLRIQAFKYIKQLLKNTTEESDYGNTYNRLVCEKMDAQQRGEDIGTTFDSELIESITKEDIIFYLTQKKIAEEITEISRNYKYAYDILNNVELAICFASLLWEIKQRSTEEIWDSKDKLRKIKDKIIYGLVGDKLNLVSVLCTINSYENGTYTLISDPFAYKTNPKLEAVPLIIDELIDVQKLFNYYGVNCELTIYVADTDYTEIQKSGLPTQENTQNLEAYINNLCILYENVPNMIISKISSVTEQNILYEKSKRLIVDEINSMLANKPSSMSYSTFESAYEAVYTSLVKRGLSTDRKFALDVIKKMWAVNGGQGAVFNEIDKQFNNLILISTEQRKRDINYTYALGKNDGFVPVIYVLKAAEDWNRKRNIK